MPLWNVDIEKQLGAEYWTNRYTVDAPSLDEAHAVGNIILGHERSVHKDVVVFTKIRTADRTPLTDVTRTAEINLPGLVVTGVENYLPLFCVVRVDFTVSEGRPSRKYLRLPILEIETTNGNLNDSLRNFVNTNYANPMAAMAGYVDVDGQNIITGTAKVAVGMRQLRRGSRRRTTPVL